MITKLQELKADAIGVGSDEKERAMEFAMNVVRYSKSRYSKSRYSKSRYPLSGCDRSVADLLLH